MTDTDDFLEHFGVKGMHWGKHTTGADGGVKAPSGIKKAYANRSTKLEIKDARGRLRSQKADIKTNIKSAKKDVKSATSPEAKAKAQAILEKNKNVKLNAEDKRVGHKLTTGEKVAAALIFGPQAYLPIVANIALTRKKDD